MMPEKRSVKALVSVKKSWTQNMGMTRLFESTESGSTAEIHIIPVSKYDISDDSFVEIEYYPKVLVDMGTSLHPKRSGCFDSGAGEFRRLGEDWIPGVTGNDVVEAQLAP
jgi:hypothetical protein